jgi:hypothetical protein
MIELAAAPPHRRARLRIGGRQVSTCATGGSDTTPPQWSPATTPSPEATARGAPLLPTLSQQHSTRLDKLARPRQPSSLAERRAQRACRTRATPPPCSPHARPARTPAATGQRQSSTHSTGGAESHRGRARHHAPAETRTGGRVSTSLNQLRRAAPPGPGPPHGGCQNWFVSPRGGQIGGKWVTLKGTGSSPLKTTPENLLTPLLSRCKACSQMLLGLDGSRRATRKPIPH